MRYSFVLVLLLCLRQTASAQLSFPLEQLLHKSADSPEFQELSGLTGMSEILEWRQTRNDQIEECHYAFKARSFHARLKMKRTENQLVVVEITAYKPGKGGPKISSKTITCDIPMEFDWDMTEKDIKARFGNATQNWYSWKGCLVQCNGFTEKSDYKLNTLIIKPAEKHYLPPTYRVDLPDEIPPVMAKVIQSADAQGSRLDRYEYFPFKPNVNQTTSATEITFTIPESAQFYIVYIVLHHTIGANVFIKDAEGKYLPCDLAPYNLDQLIYAPHKFTAKAAGKTYTIFAASENTSVHSKIGVYYFREK